MNILWAAWAAAVVLSMSQTQSTANSILVPNPGFEEGASNQPPPHWMGSINNASAQDGPTHYRSRVDRENPSQGQASVRLEHVAETHDPQQFGTVTNRVDGRPHRGRRIRLTGSVRVDAPRHAHIGLWLRVDREGRRTGFFDNMADRPIRSETWTDHVIEADVAADAEQIYFGLLLAGPGRAWLDNVRLEDIGPARTAGVRSDFSRPRDSSGPGDEPARPLDRRGQANLAAFARLYGILRFFHPSDEAASADWDAIALTGVALTERAATPQDLADALNNLFQPTAPSFEAFATDRAPRSEAAARPAGAVSARRWRHLGMGTDSSGIYSSEREAVSGVAPDDVRIVPLGAGVSARIPFAIWVDSNGQTLPRATAALPASGKPAGFVPAGFDRTSRLAAVVAAWSMFDHFYPYFDVVAVDWDAELTRALTAAATDPDDYAFHDTLRRLVAALQDGHGAVGYPREPRGTLPLAWDWVEDQLVVTHAGPEVEGVARGDIVTHVDGTPVATLIEQKRALHSGSPQWTRHLALADALSGSPDGQAELRVQGTDGRTRTARIGYRETAWQDRVREVRPEPVAELSPGIYYVDLDRVTADQLQSSDAQLSVAKGLIFDLRGYPRVPPDFLNRLASQPVRSARFEVPIYLRPDGEGVTFNDGGWTLEPVAPRFTANTVFITNGSAISYAESVLGLVAANRLGEIIGEPTAGANGNVATFTVPGGYQLRWTAMRVTNRDGSQHHLRGVQPTIPLRRTIAGIRAGRDELLDRALAEVSGNMSEGSSE